jgi:hypothetical protein
MTVESRAADRVRVLGHLRGRSRSHPERGGGRLADMSPEVWEGHIAALRGEGHQIEEKPVQLADEAGPSTGYLLRGNLFEVGSTVYDRYGSRGRYAGVDPDDSAYAFVDFDDDEPRGREPVRELLTEPEAIAKFGLEEDGDWDEEGC